MIYPKFQYSIFLSLSFVILLPIQVFSQKNCSTPEDTHQNTIQISDATALQSAISSLTSGTTLLLDNGTYKIGRSLNIQVPDVTIRSKSGQRDAVILDGDHQSTSAVADFTNIIFGIHTSNVTIADLSIRRVRHHGIHIYPGANGNIKHITLHNLHVYDCGQQQIKVNSNGGDPASWVDSSSLQCSVVEVKNHNFLQKESYGCYSGGLDVHGGFGWIVRDNLFKNIHCEGGLLEHAVHFWSRSRDAFISNNRFENSYRAIGLGMKQEASGHTRVYPDNEGEKPYFDFIGGIVVNNVIFNDSTVKLETGIELMNIKGTQILHNTIVSLTQPFNSMEYRWPNTNVFIMNNLFSHNLMPRNDAQAETDANIQNTPEGYFANRITGDLTLTDKAVNAIDKAVSTTYAVEKDFNYTTRSKPDIGAYEYTLGTSLLRPSKLPVLGMENIRLTLRRNPMRDKNLWEFEAPCQIYRITGQHVRTLMPVVK